MNTLFPDRSRSRPAAQRGIALITGMILLVVMTLLGVTAMRSSSQGTRMAANYQHKQQSFQAAESALMEMMNASPSDVAPAALAPGAVREHAGYFQASGGTDQPDVFSDLKVEYLGTSNNLLISGFQLNSTSYVYQADATGCVRTKTADTADDNCKVSNGQPMPTARTTNRMGIALIR